MPRPNLKDRRRREILDAYVACVARHGLEGATQERIAAEAGIARPLLRHNLGNRDEMVAALVEHVVAAFDEQTAALAAAASDLATMVDILFDAGHRTDPVLVLAFQSLVAAAAQEPAMRGPLLQSLTRFIDLIAAQVAKEHPDAGAARQRAAAHGVVALYANVDALSPLDPPADWRHAAKHGALALIGSLEDTPCPMPHRSTSSP